MVLSLQIQEPFSENMDSSGFWYLHFLIYPYFVAAEKLSQFHKPCVQGYKGNQEQFAWIFIPGLYKREWSLAFSFICSSKVQTKISKPEAYQ